MMLDYVLLVTLFLIGQAIGFYLGRRDQSKTIQKFCDDIGLSDLIFEITRDISCDHPSEKTNEVKEK